MNEFEDLLGYGNGKSSKGRKEVGNEKKRDYEREQDEKYRKEQVEKAKTAWKDIT